MSKNQREFLRSLFATESESLHPLLHIQNWLDLQRSLVHVEVEKIPFAALKEWYFDPQSGNILHSSGKFFSIPGINVQTNFGIKTQWQQPIVNQPEIGILGIITKKFDGVLHFLMQAKIEPGNINMVQLSPTLQATKSNYTMIHGGNRPKYLAYFTGEDGTSSNVLIDQLQSEQGARFLRKRNRNIIIEIEQDIEVYDGFIWVTLGQIKQLSRFDNTVNMDTRTVISSISYGSDLEGMRVDMPSNAIDVVMMESATEISRSIFSMDQHIAWITKLKIKYDLEVDLIPLKLVKDWILDDHSLFHRQHKYFSVQALKVNIGNREVVSWTQPIVESAQEGLIGFLVKKINGVYHFLVQAKVEAGNFDILELAPTVQCLTGNYRKGLNEYEVPFVEWFLDGSRGRTLHSSMQSEEGGRFFREQNLNIIVEVTDDFDIQAIPESYTWMTLAQLMEFIRYNNYLNIQARSLLSLIDFSLPAND